MEIKQAKGRSASIPTHDENLAIAVPASFSEPA
jgi:hypothetical protein